MGTAIVLFGRMRLCVLGGGREKGTEIQSIADATITTKCSKLMLQRFVGKNIR